MKPLLLLLFIVSATAAQAQIKAPRLPDLSDMREKARGQLESKLVASAWPRQRMKLAAGSYRSQPHALRIMAPPSVINAMPQVLLPSKEAPGDVWRLPLEQFVPDQHR